MPSKKKKFNARFPPARIKKIMQTDEDVGKVAAAVPVIISRALELFIESFMQKTATITRERNAKTLSASHIKQTIHSEKTFDFLRDLVANVPDHQPEEDGDSNPPFPSCSAAQETKKPRVQRSSKEKTGAKRGRPRKKDVVKQEEMEEEKEQTESEEEEGEEATDSDSSPTNTDQPEASSPTDMAAQPTVMQSSVSSNSTETDTSTNSMCQMSSPFTSPCLPSQNPLSPRLPMLQSPPQFPVMPHPHFQNLPHPQLTNMPLPQLQNIPVPMSQNLSMHNMPHPQLQTVANQMVPPHTGLTNQLPPPPPLRTGLSNHYPMPPNFYGPHAPQMPPFPAHGPMETFHNDQKLFMNSRETTPFSPHSNMETVNPGNNLYMNNLQNNEPLDMSKSSQNKRSPSPSQEPVTKGSKSTQQKSLVAGLPNIMNMTTPKQTNNEDDDYDT